MNCRGMLDVWPGWYGTVGAERLGAVEAYAIERLSPAPGVQVTCSAAFADYRNWCGHRGFVPLREAEFVAAVEELARSAGIPLNQRGGNLSFVDVELRGVPVARTEADARSRANK